MRLSMHTAQASTKASSDTRYHNCIFGILMISTATEMVHLTVACCIRSALGSLRNIANIARGAFCGQLLTGRTHAILPSPDTVKLPPTFRGVQHFLAPSGLEILLPFWVVWIGVSISFSRVTLHSMINTVQTFLAYAHWAFDAIALG